MKYSTANFSNGEDNLQMETIEVEEENQENYYERGMTKDETDILRLRKNNIETPIIKRQTRIMLV